MAVDVQTFTPGSGLWTKPANALWVEMFAIGGGGKGGAGRIWGSTTAYGGSGGGSGAWSRTLWPAVDLPATIPVVCGVEGGVLGGPQHRICVTTQPPNSVAAADNVVGVRFTPTVNGRVLALRYWREVDSASKVCSLWSDGGTKLGTVTDAAVATLGWRELALGTPVNLVAGTFYRASFLQQNTLRRDGQSWNAGGVSLSPLLTVTTSAGCYTPSTVDAFPTTSGQGGNFSADVVFEPGPGYGGDSYVGAGIDAAWVFAAGGGAGGDGATTLPIAGAAGPAGEWPGGAGGQSSVAAAAGAGNGSAHTGAGGAGGGISSGGGSFAGGNGGNNFVAGWRGTNGGAGGAINNPGVAGDAFGACNGSFGGGGGGAGGATGGAGGAGGLPGGGGGGGGSGTATAGVGGLGGQGRVVIVTYLSA